jgi:acyl dehydratase
MEQTNLIMFQRRDRSPLAHLGSSIPAPASLALPAFHDVRRDTIPFFEDVEVGERLDIGSKHFSAEDIIRFAKDFDPQPFHLSKEAGDASHFGGLSASGWHTGSVWMGQMVRSRTEAALNAMRRGERPARLGPSGGFENLRWIRPVLAGDTIHYTSAVRAKRVSASKPEWGIVNHYNTGINQRGEEVFSFQGMVFWERRPA